MAEIMPLDCTKLIEREGWDCATCGHRHGGRTLANICIGCPCPETSPPLSAPSTPASQSPRIETTNGIETHVGHCMCAECMEIDSASTPASPPQDRHDICPRCGTDLGAITSGLLSMLTPQRYGCTQCGNDYGHTPLTVNVPGVPARTYFFCSCDCRNTWLGSPASSPQEKP